MTPMTNFATSTTGVRLVMEFCSEKTLGIDSEWFPIFRGRKCSFQGVPRFTEKSILKLGTDQNYMKKLVLQKTCSSKQNWKHVFVCEMLRTEFWWEFASFFVLQNGILNCFLFRGMVENGIPSICFYFFPRNGFQVVFFSAEWFRTDSESFLLLKVLSSGN